MIRVQKVECESRLGAESRGRVPIIAQELPVVLEISTLGTFAEADTDSVMAGKVDDKQPLGFCRHIARFPRVSKVDNQTETFEGYPLEKAIGPDLG